MEYFTIGNVDENLDLETSLGTEVPMTQCKPSQANVKI